MNISPDPQTLATARLFENLATLVKQVRVHAAEQYARIDSFPTQTPGHNPEPKVAPSKPLHGYCTHNVPDDDDPNNLIDCGHVRPCPQHDTPVTLTPTERAAAERERIRLWLDDYESRIKLAATIGFQAIEDGHKFIGTVLTVGPECRDGQHGKDLPAKLAAEIAVCHRHAETSGLCARHYMAWYRARKAVNVS